MEPYIEEAEKYLIHTYNRYPIIVDHGEGVTITDVKGKPYLDFMAGIAVFALGYGNKEFNDAIKGQIDKIIHTSNLFYHPYLGEAAKKLAMASGLDRVFFTNSGTEAIEGAIKLARKYSYERHGGAEIISMKHSFHGRSLGALSVTGNDHYQEPFRPLMGGVSFADFNDLDSVRACINKNTCAIILEPVQGEGGIHPATKEFMEGIRTLCNEHGLLMICDEIQCGMGRCGSMFAYEQYGIKPDIITSAKALGCGIPVGAFAAAEHVAASMVPGDHGSTYGGNPLAAAAVSKVFDLYEKNKILLHVNEISVYLEKKLSELAERKDAIVERRGIGLMQGLEFRQPAAPIINRALEKGLLLIGAGPCVIRFVPPLIIEKEHIDKMISILETCF